MSACYRISILLRAGGSGPPPERNRHLHAAMTESALTVCGNATRPAWPRSGEEAAIAVARTPICIAWAVMEHNAGYAQADAAY